MWIVRQYRSNWLANKSYFIVGQDRLVVEGWSVIRIRNPLFDIIYRDYVKNSRSLLCRTEIERYSESASALP